MKWIQGKWKQDGEEKASGSVVLINPQYITTVDLTRKLLWAEDCDTAVEWEDDELELINKMTCRPAEEELKKNSSPAKGEK
jgi:hypothetical protein